MSVAEIAIRRSWESPLPLLLSDVKNSVIQQVHARIAEEGFGGMRHKHGYVFRFINEQGCRLTDLADRARITKQGVGQVVSDLEQLGYIERVPAPDDGRAKIIRLTERGVKCRDAAARVLMDIEQAWAVRFGDDQVVALRFVLEGLVGERV